MILPMQKAAIKKMDMQASKEFLAELKVLTRVHHLNLVLFFRNSMSINFVLLTNCTMQVEIYSERIFSNFNDWIQLGKIW